MGYQALLHDLGFDIPLRVWTDSSAAIGICTRQGFGKLRHLDTHTLWIQQAVRTGRVDLRKMLGEQNPADLRTKHSLSRQRVEGLVTLFGCKYLGGRAASAPQMRRGDASRITMADAERDVGAVQTQEEEHAGETSPCMPHLDLSEAQLERLYPRLEAPDSDQLDDLQDDRCDIVYQHGLEIARKIREQSQAQGRRRRPVTAETARSELNACSNVYEEDSRKCVARALSRELRAPSSPGAAHEGAPAAEASAPCNSLPLQQFQAIGANRF